MLWCCNLLLNDWYNLDLGLVLEKLSKCLISVACYIGYRIVTPRRQNIGEVNTYDLLVENVLEIIVDTIVVYKAADS
ncbi:hypothetical protein V6N13_048161 [Hibiscus sabdariffa]